MADGLRRIARWSIIGWFWVSVLVVLPNCSSFTSAGGTPVVDNLAKGGEPRSDAIFCDIEKVLTRRCADERDLAVGIRLVEAAVAMNEGRTSNIGLDYSAEARGRCGGDRPEAVEFHGAFPAGLPVCVNCGAVVGTPAYPDVNAACRAQCYDFFGTTGPDGSIAPKNPPDAAVVGFCNGAARASTNQPLNSCFGGACPSQGGDLLPGYDDPRKNPEPVVWTDFIGAARVGGPDTSDLTRTAAGTGEYDAGAVSEQWIRRGDAYVEFTVNSASHSHFLGLTEVPTGCATPAACPDTSGSYTTMGFAVMLHSDSRYYIAEHGAGVPGAGFNESWGDYVAGERFRVRVRDNSDGTATITYQRVIGACTPGTACNVQPIYTHVGAPRYPLRVDTSLREQNATLINVRIVRIR